MTRLWIVLAALVALFVFARIRARRKAQPRRLPPAGGPRIQGSLVSAWVHPRMSATCLFDAGLQFGKGFRRKEGPQLPHDDACGCRIVPFSFTSSEVFNGALRNLNPARACIEGMEGEQAQRLLERLRDVESQPVAPAGEDYVAAVAPERFPPELREAVRAFLMERHAWLAKAPAAERPETGSAAPAQDSTMKGTEPTSPGDA